MVDKLINIIQKLRVPKVILRYIMVNFLDLSTINNLLFTVKEMNILDMYSKDLIVKANKGFEWNCQNGHLTVVQWLYSLDEVDIHVDNESAFRMTCQNGHLTVAQWLYSLGGVNIHAHDGYAFSWSCANGHLPVAKWLYSLGVDTHANDEYAFLMSCGNGHLTVAKWVYSLGEEMDRPDPSPLVRKKQGRVNIHTNNEYPFRLACLYGHLAVAKWLYSLGGVNIYAHNKYAFKCANKGILNWLNNLPSNTKN